jgi:hypothetical protein
MNRQVQFVPYDDVRDVGEQFTTMYFRYRVEIITTSVNALCTLRTILQDTLQKIISSLEWSETESGVFEHDSADGRAKIYYLGIRRASKRFKKEDIREMHESLGGIETIISSREQQNFQVLEFALEEYGRIKVSIGTKWWLALSSHCQQPEQNQARPAGTLECYTDWAVDVGLYLLFRISNIMAERFSSCPVHDLHSDNS